MAKKSAVKMAPCPGEGTQAPRSTDLILIFHTNIRKGIMSTKKTRKMRSMDLSAVAQIGIEIRK
ncbi:MAG: hypothetical protein ACYDHX_00945 [Methanothrix sp.]